MSLNPSVEVHVDPNTNTSVPGPPMNFVSDATHHQGVVAAFEVHESGVRVAGPQRVVAQTTVQDVVARQALYVRGGALQGELPCMRPAMWRYDVCPTIEASP